jgi:23S rRNA (adenine-N6)-dimethyltransferase
VATRRRTPRHAVRPSGQHFLRSRAIAAELVDQAGICADDLVVEIGAGTGCLTEALGSRAGRVLAVELDPELAARLGRAYAGNRRITVIEADAMVVPLPGRPFRVFGNLPFGVTAQLLRRLLDEPSSPLVRADVIVQYEVARKRTAPWPSSLRSLCWAPWWDFAIARRLPSASFDPPPSVDAAVLSITRRAPPVLEPGRRPEFERLISRAFGGSPQPVRRIVRVPPLPWKHFARERGIRREATARELTVFDWVALHRLVAVPEGRDSRPTGSSARRRPTGRGAPGV